MVCVLWQVLGKEAEKFGGDTLLNGQEKLSIIRQQMDGWTDNALKVFSRHRKEGANSHPDQEGMMTLNEASHIHHPYSQFNAPYHLITVRSSMHSSLYYVALLGDIIAVGMDQFFYFINNIGFLTYRN